MHLSALLAEGRLRQHRISAKEVAALLAVADRDLEDAAIPQLSTDRRFATAYNAALALATIPLHANSCRAKRNMTDYDRVGGISEAEAEELLAEARAFRRDVLEWLRAVHPGQPAAARD